MCLCVTDRHGKLPNFLQVQFVEEEAVDTGGPSREFWRLIVQEVVRQYCVGEPGISLFVKNVPALQVCVCMCICTMKAP